MDARVDYFRPITKPASVFVIGEGGTTFGSTQNGYPLVLSWRRIPAERIWNKRAIWRPVLFFPDRIFA